MLRIAYIGYGIVGKACHATFKHNAEHYIIDPKYNKGTIKDLKDAVPDIVFVSINAPTMNDGTIDASAIYSIFQQLTDIQYKGVVVLKSTLTPDIVDDLYVKFGHCIVLKKHGPLRYVYSPEFLRENNWEEDALDPPMILLGGDYADCRFIEDMYRNHSHVPRHKKIVITDYKTASLTKYAINSFLATKVTFMNQLYNLYAEMNDRDTVLPDTWKYFTDILSTDIRIGHTHMDVPGPDGEVGFGGSCFPKDLRALRSFDKNGRLSIIDEVLQANMKLRLQGKK